MKPFVLFPGMACLLASLALTGRRNRRVAALMAVDMAGVLAGGVVVGILSIAWLRLSGNWPAFLASTLGSSNSEYFQRSHSWAVRITMIVYVLWPWCLIHLLALPVAVAVLARGLQNRHADSAPQCLLATCYLGWFAQANFVQQQFDYHLVPPLLLAITLLAGESELLAYRAARWVMIPAFLVWMLAVHPFLRSDRMELWARCWREGSSAEMRDRLTLSPYYVAPTWVDLQTVAQFLRSQGVRDRELTCFCDHTMWLYANLDLKPSTRYLLPQTCLHFLKNQRPRILGQIQSSPEVYLVTDCKNLEGQPDEDYQVADVFPYNQPVVFRSGRYAVHRVGPKGMQRENGAPRGSAAQLAPSEGDD
jgi:hypothetical protein